jgi:hypothetical protein
MTRKEEACERLFAAGYLPEDLTWVPEGSAVGVELTYLRGQDAVEELRKALDLAQSGQWVIKATAVERRIRSMPGCENYTLDDNPLPTYAAKAYGSRAAR